MSKRDRAARAKGAADAEATDAENVDAQAGSDDDSSSTTPSGKRSATPRGKRGAATVEAERGSVAVKDRPRTAPDTAAGGSTRNPFVRIWTFLTQVVAELRKVIWPTRQEMIRYTIIVLIFVVVLTAFISGIDLGFARVVLWLFG